MTTHFFFLWVPSVDLALSRVRGRVLEGGHDVPEAAVRRRFGRSIRNFFVHIVGSRIHGLCSTIQAQHPMSSPLKNRARSV